METFVPAAIIATFGLCWLNEVRICARLREQHAKCIDEAVKKYEDIIERERAAGWEEGRQYEIARRNHQHPRSRGQFTEKIERTK